MAKSAHSHQPPKATANDQGRDVIPASYGGAGKVAAVPEPGQAKPSRDEWTPAPTGTPGNWDQHDQTMQEAAQHTHYTGGKANAPCPFGGKR